MTIHQILVLANYKHAEFGARDFKGKHLQRNLQFIFKTMLFFIFIRYF